MDKIENKPMYETFYDFADSGIAGLDDSEPPADRSDVGRAVLQDLLQILIND